MKFLLICYVFQELLFPPYSEKRAVQFPTRNTVPLLNNAQYQLYEKACTKLVKDWLDERIGYGAPTENWEKEMIKEVCGQNVYQGVEELNLSKSDTRSEAEELENIKDIYDKLKERKVPTHLRTTTSHRKWLRMTLEFCQMTGGKFSGDIEELIKRHDLSKYTAEEVLGYAVMFGDEQVNQKQLGPQEKTEWNLSLEHHYIHNPHHPEYFYVKQADGTREKFDIIEAVPDNGKLYMEESLIDMMASRGERNLKDDATISVEKWLDIDERYMKRYAEADRKYVMELLDTWKKSAMTFVEDKDNAEKLKALFGRDVEH